MVAASTSPNSYSIFSEAFQEDDSTPNSRLLSVCVKNTFIDVEDVETASCVSSGARSRCSSAPPKMEGNSDAGDEEDRPYRASSFYLPPKATMVSPEESESEDEETKSYVESPVCSPRSPYPVVAAEHGAMKAKFPPPPPLEPAPLCIIDRSACDEYNDSSPLCCQNQIAYRTPLNLRSPLNVRARPFGTKAAMNKEVAVPLSAEVKARFLAIVQALHIALNSCRCVEQLQLVVGADSCQIRGTYQTKHYSQVDNTLKQALNKMLEAASASTDVYVIGYEANPFSPLLAAGIGATARLAIVSNMESACWDLVGKGFCRYGRVCRWHHPQSEMPVEVALSARDS